MGTIALSDGTFVVHGSIDGYSWMIVSLVWSTNMVYKLFKEATETLGVMIVPIRVVKMC